MEVIDRAREQAAEGDAAAALWLENEGWRHRMPNARLTFDNG